MAGVGGDESGAGRSAEGIANGQHCQSGEALAEWRSSEQLENGTPSTSPPFWDTDDEDDDDAGLRPSGLYGRYTWTIENFSQINKRELRSNTFEVGGYNWYILIYPQGCEVCNHLSLFLCVANHEKLLPGWGHFAQFTIAVVNKDPKKSKYSDTLHRFWKKEHDWGWKKFMELSKVFDGFIDADTLVIKAQVQVIRERADRPFRCLDCQYRRELVKVYLTNVEQICRRFVEDRREKLETLIEDKARWSSFCAFWLGIDQNSRRRMSREKTDVILKVVVKHFFIEKEVTSTLVVDSLYSGLKALEGHVKCKKGKLKLLDTDEMPAPIIRVENDTFVLVDDVLLLLERIALEPLPPKDEKAPQNRMKDGNSGEDFSKDSIERAERRLTELGRRTVEIFALAHIFSNKIEVAYQEAVALKRQEELIREEEAAWLVESEQKAKRGSTEKEKKPKKKQGKQKRNSRRSKDKTREEKASVAEVAKPQEENPGDVKEGFNLEERQTVAEKSDRPEDASDVSDSMDGVNEELPPDSEDRDASPVNWDTDTSEIHLPTEASTSGVSGLLCVQNGNTDKRSSSAVDDSSSTCSTDSVPSVVGGPWKAINSNQQNKKLTSRGKNQWAKATCNGSNWTIETDNQISGPAVDAVDHNDVSVSNKVCESESDAVVSSSPDQIKCVKQQTVEEEAIQKNTSTKEPLDLERAKERSSVVSSSRRGPYKNPACAIQSRSEYKNGVSTNHVSVRKVSSNSSQNDLAASSSTSSQLMGLPKSESQVAVASKPTEKFLTPQALMMSRPSSAPLIPAPRPTAPVVSMVQTAPLLACSASAVGRLGPDPSPAIPSHVPQSYRNAITGNHVGSSSGLSHQHSPSSVVSPLPAYSQPRAFASAPMFVPQTSERSADCVQSSLPFGMVNRDTFCNGSQWVQSSQRDASKSMLHDSSLVGDIQNFDLHRPVDSGSREQFSDEILACTSGRHTHGAMADEFPHLDIINDLLNEEHGIGKVARSGAVFPSVSNGSHMLHRQFSFPSDLCTSGELGSSSSSCRFERTRSFHDDGFQHGYSSLSSQFDGFTEFIPQVTRLHYAEGQMDGLIPAQWQMAGPDLSLLAMRNAEGDSYPYFSPEYSNLACGVNGYSVFRPSKGR